MAQAKMTDARAILTFMFGGNAIMTLRSVQTGDHYTYKIREAKIKNFVEAKNQPTTYFVDLLTGPDNLNDYTYIGCIFNQKTFKLTGKSRATKDTPSVIAFKWSFESIVKGKVPAALEVWHEGRCGRCGRTLTDAESIATGFGPECSEKIGVRRVELPVVGVSQVDQFKKRLSSVTLRDMASPVREVPNHKIEESVADFKATSPEAYYQDGELTEPEAHAVAYMKFKHELSKK